MATTTKKIVSTVNSLIQTCRDGEEGYRTAAAAVENVELKRLFERYAMTRAGFAIDLEKLVRSFGEEAEDSGTAAGAVARGWISLKGGLTGGDDAAILAECERGEDVAIKNYQKALEEDLPADVRRIFETQYREIEQAHDQIHSLRDAIKSKSEAH